MACTQELRPALDDLPIKIRAARAKGATLRRERRVAALEGEGARASRRADVAVVEVEGEARVRDVLERSLQAGAQVVEVTPRRETLEDLFLRRAL